jgi:ubiquinone/menaquinone biosynthesis C-methylase UbiE
VNILDKTKTKLDKNGIWITNVKLSKEEAVSQNAWGKIYNYSLKKLAQDRKDFNKDKLDDHMNYIGDSYKFTSRTNYLEIGCGPAYIGEHLMKTYNCYFIGVDFNYPMLLTLKKYFDKKGYKKYLLIFADINDMPIKRDTIDYIYGGGVIEHLPDTNQIVEELCRVLRKGGVAFNTVPAFSFWWIIRCFNNIPSIKEFRKIFEFIHLKLLKSRILEKYYGYELSFTVNNLRSLHKKNGFSSIKIGAFAFHPSTNKLKNVLLRSLYYKTQTSIFTTAMYFVSAKK